MRQVDSAALNQYNPANIVVDQLNADPSSNIQGMIARNSGAISHADLAAFVNAFYFSTGKASRKEILTVKKELQEKFNAYLSSDLSLTDHTFSTKEIAVIMYCFKHEKDYIAAIDYLMQHIDEIPSGLFSVANGKVRRKLLNELAGTLEMR